MRIIITLFIATSLFVSNAWAQQDPHFSQFMLNKSYWSPALTAIEGKGSVSLLSRAQWVGYEATYDPSGKAPTTQFLNFSTPFTIKNLPLALGSTIIYDQLGEMSNLSVQISLAYRKEFNRGTLSFGIRPEVINQTLDFNKLRFGDSSDKFNIGTKESQTAFDLGAGVSFNNDQYTIAAGVSHLLRPSFDYGVEGASASSNISMIYTLYGEYYYTLTYNVKLTPSLLVKSDLNSFSVDLAVIATYNKKLWGGLSYRNAEAMVIMFGYSFLQNGQLKAGYSFDYIIKEQDAKQPTSHEIFLSFDLPSFSTGAKKIIRTPRFRH